MLFVSTLMQAINSYRGTILYKPSEWSQTKFNSVFLQMKIFLILLVESIVEIAILDLLCGYVVISSYFNPLFKQYPGFFQETLRQTSRTKPSDI